MFKTWTCRPLFCDFECFSSGHLYREAICSQLLLLHYGNEINELTNSSYWYKSMKKRVKCEAYARSTDNPCQAKALPNGRCKNHGGMSTGPKTPEGRQAISEATRQRMATGQRKRVLEGFYAWLDGGGRDYLSRLAKARERRKRWRRLMLQ